MSKYINKKLRHINIYFLIYMMSDETIYCQRNTEKKQTKPR